LIKWHAMELGGMAEAEFRVRCFQPLSHLSVAAKGANILSVGGYVSNARRLNKNSLLPGAKGVIKPVT
jgi:hypothetical protein